jgi:hypothetical protein
MTRVRERADPADESTGLAGCGLYRESGMSPRVGLTGNLRGTTPVPVSTNTVEIDNDDDVVCRHANDCDEVLCGSTNPADMTAVSRSRPVGTNR